jgi:hypothetical protein
MDNLTPSWYPLQVEWRIVCQRGEGVERFVYEGMRSKRDLIKGFAFLQPRHPTDEHLFLKLRSV